MQSSDYPLVSIVTPVLNRAEQISACLASVSSQGYPNIEHIVVDGGSSDGTLERIKSFTSNHQFHWISEPDGGMYEAVNKGLSLARGEVLAYLNSDDFYLPWSVETAIKSLSDNIDVVYGDLGVLFITPDGQSNFRIQFYPSFDLTYFAHVATLGQPSVFWRRKISEKIGGFDTSYRLLGDCEYWLRAATEGSARFTHVNEVLAIQIDHADTLRATQSEQLTTEFKRVRSHYSGVISPPRNPRWWRYKKSLRWRQFQLRMMIEIYRREPSRWPRFIEFMRSNDIRVNRPARALASLLPARYRPGWAMKIDKSAFESRLLTTIGADGFS